MTPQAVISCAGSSNVIKAEAKAALPDIDLLAGRPELISSPFSYARGEEIYGEGEETDYVYKLVSGAVRTCKILSDGRRQINGFHLPGDLFGFEPCEARRLTAEAVVDAKVLVFKRRQLERLASRNAEVACQLWSLTAAGLQHAEEHMLLLGRRTALERVAAFLLDLDRRLGCAGSFDLPMCRRDMADYLGLTLETVSRSMSQLQADKAVALCGARRLVLNKSIMSRVVED